MTSSRYPQITDELLSAYIDNQVTDDEKVLIETAIAEDPLLAWQLESLRYTVDLLHTLPQLALPRSFVLADAQLVDGAVSMPTLTEPARVRTATVRRTPQPVTESGGFWLGWRNFWQMGNLFLRNAAAASLALFLVVSAGSLLLESPLRTQSANQPVRLSDMPAAAQQQTSTASAPETDTAQVIAMLQTTTTQAISNAKTGLDTAETSGLQPAEEQAESTADNSPPSIEAILSPVANGAQPAYNTQALTQGDATDTGGGQGGDAAMLSAGQRGMQSATSSADRSNNGDLAPSGPQAQSAPVFPIADTSASSVVSFSVPSTTITGAVTGESAVMTDAVTATVALSASTTVSLPESSTVTMPVTSSLSVVTDAFSESLRYSATIVDATISPTSNVAVMPIGEPTIASYGPIVDNNAAPNPITLLRIFQLVSALAAFLLGGLWWRSRSTSLHTR